MRELKFRVWNKRAKVYDEYFELLPKWTQNGDQIIDNKAFIIEQYTGLKDKNGKEIYEGDILQIDDHILGDFEVLWNNLAWKIKMSFGYETLYVHKPENIVVIGNIHENSELLEEEE